MGRNSLLAGNFAATGHKPGLGDAAVLRPRHASGSALQALDQSDPRAGVSASDVRHADDLVCLSGFCAGVLEMIERE